jgi:hypothetical protein
VTRFGGIRKGHARHLHPNSNKPRAPLFVCPLNGDDPNNGETSKSIDVGLEGKETRLLKDKGNSEGVPTWEARDSIG